MKESTSTPPTTGNTPNGSSPPTASHFPLWRRPCLRAYARTLHATDWPILVGPFRGEVGFEALYWIPFVHQLAKTLQIPPERLIPISRGGAAAWYGTPRGMELYAMRTPAQVRIENRLQFQRRAMMKQTVVTPFDRAILRDAAETLGLGHRYRTLHPAWMYHALEPFWAGTRGLAWLQPQVHFADLPVVPLPGTLTLPDHFVAVRFYFRSTFPLTPQTALFARETIKQIAAQHPVILLNTGLHADDHHDYEPKVLPPNVYRLADLVPLLPERNLAVLSAVLARSVGFVGTYGGLAQLALRYRRPVVGLYQDWVGTALAHRALSEALATLVGVPFQVLRVTELPMLQTVLPRVTLAPVQKGLDNAKDVAQATG